MTEQRAADGQQHEVQAALGSAAARARGSIDVREVAAEPCSDEDGDTLLVTVRAAAPSADAWSVDDVRALRMALRAAAAAAGVNERVVVLFRTAEGTGSESARPQQPETPQRPR